MAFVSNSLDFPNNPSKATPTTSDVMLISDAADNDLLKTASIGSLPFSPPSGASAVNVTGATQAMAINTEYWVNRVGGACTLTLPPAAGASLGDFVRIRGGELVDTPWVIDYDTNQFIRMFGSVTTTTSGTLTADDKYNDIVIQCSDTAGTGLSWKVTYVNGTFTGA